MNTLLAVGIVVAVVVLLGASVYYRQQRRQRRNIRAGGSTRPTGTVTTRKKPAKDPIPRNEIATRADWLDYLEAKYDTDYTILRDDVGNVRVLLDFPNGDRVVGQGETIEEAFPNLLDKLGEL